MLFGGLDNNILLNCSQKADVFLVVFNFVLEVWVNKVSSSITSSRTSGMGKPDQPPLEVYDVCIYMYFSQLPLSFKKSDF